MELGGRPDGVSSGTFCHVASVCLFSSFWAEGTLWGQVQGTSHSRFLVSLWVAFGHLPRRPVAPASTCPETRRSGVGSSPGKMLL